MDPARLGLVDIEPARPGMVAAEDAMRDRKAMHLRVHNTMTTIMDVARASVERRRAS